MRQLSTFHDFVGQSHIVNAIQTHVAGCLSKGLAFPHTLLGGSSGFGKTMLAKAIAKALGTNCLSFFCSPQTKPWQIASLIAAVKSGDLVFLDEIHSLPDAVQELLFLAIDEHRVPAVDNETKRIVPNEYLTVPKFTIVVASDQIGKLRNALHQRLVLRFTLTPYTIREMRDITRNYASDLGILLGDHGVTRLAEASRGTPRRAHHLLESLYACLPDVSVTVSRADVARHLDTLGIDSENLEPNDWQYLHILASSKGYVSLDSACLQLGMDVLAVRRNIETYLLRRGLIETCSRGRFLTESGKALVNARKLP